MTPPNKALSGNGGGEQRVRPILMSAPMMRAHLEHRKTQTRRLVKGRQPTGAGGFHIDRGFKGGHPVWVETVPLAMGRQILWLQRCPYGQPGDLLYARETWGVGNRPCPSQGWVDGVEYRADCIDDDAPPLYDIIPPHVEADSIRDGWRPSIHMPRWASRLTLAITEIRVARLHDISEADAMAEGITRIWREGSASDTGPNRYTVGLDIGGMGWSANAPTAAGVYRMLWEHINGDGSWEANPWVWAISYTPHLINVDSYISRATGAQTK